MHLRVRSLNTALLFSNVLAHKIVIVVAETTAAIQAYAQPQPTALARSVSMLFSHLGLFVSVSQLLIGFSTLRTLQPAATRCCPDADGSECRCPAKEGDAFQNKIGVYCSAIADDGACSKQDLSAAMKNLRGGIIATGGEKLPDFDREEQVERIAEFAP